MDKIMLLFLVVIAAGFVLATVIDDLTLAIACVGQAIIWSAFHLGDKLENR